MAGRKNAKFRSGLQIALLVLPLAALVALGAYFIARDRRSVKQEARDRASEIAQAALDRLQNVATNIEPSLYLKATNRWPEGTAFFVTGPNAELLFPASIRKAEPVDARAALSGEAAALWSEAEQAEFEKEDPALAIATWDRFLKAQPPEPGSAIARLKRAVLLEKTGDTNSARQALLELLNDPNNATAESGIPVAHLAALKIVDMGGGRGGALNDSSWASSITEQIRKQLAEPSEFTPYFLREGIKLTGRPEFQEALRIWEDHERARHLHTKWLEVRGGALDSGVTDSEPVILAGDKWWVMRSGTNMFLRSTRNIESLVAGIGRDLRPPSYLALKFAPTADSNRKEPTLAAAGNGVLRLEVHLADASALYATQRQRAWLFGAVLASCVAVAGIGLVQIHRNSRRQERLNELKSNFVSSVSHELRAPLASMRLMSEGLQSGRVLDAAKQREYFDFLVQECRRLSVLVENVLDFSRIEQDRKAYEFAEASVREICEASLKTIGPTAREQGVKLKLVAAEDVRAVVDALALQQAIVNLLDNAVKHSAAGDEVVLSLRRDWQPNEQLEISVQDRGCGIPESEHERIFEQFYRLGSELRRETQGVGIGLAIVKHTAEAHRGSVEVESAPGAGAKFTIRIPTGAQTGGKRK